MLGALIGGCSAESTDSTQSNRVNATPLTLPEAKVVAAPPATPLTVLPSVEEVLVAVPERRTDPFAPLPKRTSEPELGDAGEAGLESPRCALCGRSVACTDQHCGGIWNGLFGGRRPLPWRGSAAFPNGP